jgi:(p)ppGpp synthase/HD superfamily hydrolase
MPLHAITEVYGEEGLRDRFALELEALPRPAQEQLSAVLAYVSVLHEGQRRVREPYLNHLLRVTLRILCYYRITDVEVLTAALLHDAVEDQAWRITGRPETDDPPPTTEALVTIAERYGHRVARLVDAVTNPDYDPHRDRNEQYRNHVAEALEYEPWARVIKISDFTDNGVGIIHTTGPKLVKAATKYAPLVPILRDLVSRSDTPLDDEAKQHILEQFDLAEVRFKAILGN